MVSSKLIPEHTLFFLCDVQTRFRSAIHGFDEVVATTNKMLKIAKILGCEVVVTEQNPKALGNTVPEIDLASLESLHLATFDKTSFTMVTPQVKSILSDRANINSIVLFGIETHVCVLQTALDLIDLGYKVHVLADGVSSCNKQETPIAMERIRQSGGYITTSESAVFQLMRDSSKPTFRSFSAVIKDEKERTQKAMETLLQQQRSLL